MLPVMFSLPPAAGLLAALPVLSALALDSFCAKPKLNGLEAGGVLRLLSAGLLGRVPIGAGAVVGLVVRGGEPPGDDVEVLEDCCAAFPESNTEKFWAFEAGEELLSARERLPDGFGEGPLVASSTAEDCP